jgi:hypothetical protein
MTNLAALRRLQAGVAGARRGQRRGVGPSSPLPGAGEH